MGLHKKADALCSLNPDLAVIPECSEISAIALQDRGFESLRFGSNPLKGIGIFCRKGLSIRALHQPHQNWIVPVAVDAPEPFTLLAVWACKMGDGRAESYIGLVYQALMSHPEWFGSTPVLLAGDLNSNRIWDAKREVGNHSDVVRVVAERGMVSAYHEFFGEAQGAETRRTFYQFRHEHRPYHIDYIFLPREWASRLRSVNVGDFERWSKLSDHCPVVVEL